MTPTEILADEHRLILEVFPSDAAHQIWSAGAYMVSGLVWLVCAGIVGWAASR